MSISTGAYPSDRKLDTEMDSSSLALSSCLRTV